MTPLPSDTTGLITVSNLGIFNSIEAALKNASKQNKAQPQPTRVEL
jgi:hypothetical protein